MWLLGSLAGDGAASREIVLSQGALPQVSTIHLKV